MFAAAIAAVCGRLFLHPTAWPLYYPAGDLGQTFWNYWWFDFGVVARGGHPLRCDWLYHPVGCGLTFHTMDLLYCAVMWPVRAWAGAAAAYNIQITASYALTMGFTYALARESGLSRYAATLAGLAAGLGRYRFTFAFQMSVLSTQWIPLYFWMLIRMLKPPEDGDLPAPAPNGTPAPNAATQAGRPAPRKSLAPLWLGLSVVCMLTSVWYYLLFCAVLTPIFLAAAMLRDHALWRRRWLWRRSAVAMAVAAPVFLFYGWSAWTEARDLPPAVYPGDRQRIDNSAALAEYLLHPRLAAALSEDKNHQPLLGRTGGNVERLFFLPGYALAILALGAAGRRRRASDRFASPRFWLGVALGAMILSFGPRLVLLKSGPAHNIVTPLWMPYEWLQRLPVFEGISQLFRLGWIVTLAVAVAGAAFAEPAIAALGRRLAGVPERTLRLVLVALVFVESYAGRYPVYEGRPSPFVEFLRTQPGDCAVIELPDENVFFLGRYMLDQTFHEKRLMGGYTSRGSLRFEEFAEQYEPLQRLRAAIGGVYPAMGPVDRRRFLGLAAQHGLRFVVLNHELDSAVHRTRAAQRWLIEERLAAPVFEDRTHAVMRMMDAPL